MFRLGILAPTKFSLLGRLLADWAINDPNIELAIVVVRRMFSRSRISSEIRRDGKRIARKVWRKAVLDGNDTDETSALHGIATSRNAPSTLNAIAEAHDVPLITVGDFNEVECVSAVLQRRVDAIAFAGGGIVRQSMLRAARIGILNAHMGVLPNYRGMDVVEWALLENHPEQCGVTVHLMDEGIDTGPIMDIWRANPQPRETVSSIRSRLEVAMFDRLVHTIGLLAQTEMVPTPQQAAAGRQYYVMHRRLQAMVNRRSS